MGDLGLHPAVQLHPKGILSVLTRSTPQHELRHDNWSLHREMLQMHSPSCKCTLQH